tara:strand:+ start:145430 stop:146569 length:1140 start_codon:yes stop_codon:yes gene_type:complete
MYENLPENQKIVYRNILQRVSTLSALFNEGDVPYLDYRVHENSYCFAFNARNTGRADDSVDAIIGDIGIGLKTFLHGNGRTLQKVAEFNADLPEILNAENDEEIVRNVSELRNIRIQLTIDIYGLQNTIYHLCTRLNGLLHIYEEDMIPVDVDGIRNVVRRRNVISFNDGNHDYSFNIGKSTLSKRFVLGEPVDIVEVQRLENPFEFLLDIDGIGLEDLNAIPNNFVPGEDYIVLPLYSTRDPDMAPARGSGLNQWNAGGRARENFEVYIPFPSVARRACPNFFVMNKDHVFNLQLPNGDTLTCKLCQDDLKALMSNPNSALGEWLLRDVLRVPQLQIVTRHDLDIAGTDSVRIRKIDNENYSIDFDEIGAYEEFIDNL